MSGGAPGKRRPRSDGRVRLSWVQRPQVGVTVFDPDVNDTPIVAPRHRTVYQRDVYFHRGRGALSAAYRDLDGLTYVVTADLDEESLARVLAASFHPLD